MVKTRFFYLIVLVIISVAQLLIQGCAHKKAFDRDELQSKRVALAEIKSAAQSKTQVEVAIINEILEHGRFEIVDRTSVQEALVTYPTQTDWKRLGEKLDADYIMSVRVAEFKVDERHGYDVTEEEDSVLAEEAGQSKPIKTKNYYKVKSYTGFVRLLIVLFDVKRDAIAYQGSGESNQTVNSRDMNMPGKMKLLETLTHKAVTDFFEKIP